MGIWREVADDIRTDIRETKDEIAYKRAGKKGEQMRQVVARGLGFFSEGPNNPSYPGLSGMFQYEMVVECKRGNDGRVQPQVVLITPTPPNHGEAYRTHDTLAHETCIGSEAMLQLLDERLAPGIFTIDDNRVVIHADQFDRFKEVSEQKGPMRLKEPLEEAQTGAVMDYREYLRRTHEGKKGSKPAGRGSNGPDPVASR